MDEGASKLRALCGNSMKSINIINVASGGFVRDLLNLINEINILKKGCLSNEHAII